MRADWSQLKARISNRLARHFRAAPLRLPGDAPMVSFTFDDVPKSAATVGATILEEYGGRATLYVAGSLVGQWSGLRAGIDADEIIGLHRNGHEIACHTFSHRRATELDAAAMEAEIEQNRLDAVRKLRVSLRSCARVSSATPFARRAASFPASTATSSICISCVQRR
jgi:peptidoglycan/xylan/chitin deacetylase (PgdA/CDA1 family)